MATALKLRRGTTSQHASFTGSAAEVTVDTDKNTVVVHNGSTAGGIPLAKETNPTINGNVTTTGLNFDSNTFVIDATNNTVGIGTATPDGVLEVVGGTNGQVIFRSTKTANTQSTARIMGGAYSGNPFVAMSINGLSSGPSNQLIVGGGSGLGEPATTIQFNTGTAGSLGAGTERMRIDSSGNVGIGTSSPGNKLDVVGSDNTVVARIRSTSGTIRFLPEDGGASKIAALNGADNAFYPLITQGSNLQFVTGTTERMRIDSSGNLLVGATAQQTGGNGKLSVAGGSGGVAATLTNNSNGSAYTTEVYNYTTSTGAGTGRYVKFAMGSTPNQTGSIIGDGTNTAFNTSSDYRLKENVEPMAGALALVMQQRPVTWVWKSNGKLGKGFIAHWLQEDGAGECVSGEKDAVDADGNPEYQGIDTSFLVATLTAAIQELKGIVDAQALRITALENK